MTITDILALIMSLVIIISFLPALRSSGWWWIRMFDFLQLQILALGLPLLGAYLFLANPYEEVNTVLVVVYLIAMGMHAYRLLPYTGLYPMEVDQARFALAKSTVSFFTANVLMTNRNAEPLKSILEDADPDVIFLTEPDDWWEREMAYLETRYPYFLKAPKSNTYGLLFYSRFPFEEAEIRHIIDPEIPSVRAVITLPIGLPVEIFGLHPRPPEVAKDTHGRDFELMVLAKEIAMRNHPAVAIGDFNDVVWSPMIHMFLKTSRLLDPRKGRGLFSTFHTRLPFLRYPIDQILVSWHFRIVKMRRCPHFGSDHFPLFMQVSCFSKGAPSQEDATPLPIT